MTQPRIRHLAFLTPGNYPPDNPAAGLEDTLHLIAYGESLGYDSAWVRQRHLEPGISSAAVFLAAATQRTRRIELGTAVIQMGYENPFRLAEDLATLDTLSGGRLHAGLSGGPAPLAHLLGDLVPEEGTGGSSHGRLERLKIALESRLLGDESTVIVSAAGRLRPRLHPIAPGLPQRLWYGGGSQRSAAWAGRNAFHFLTGNIVTGEGTDLFEEAQLRLIATFRGNWNGPGEGRVALGRVIVPLDGADAPTRRRYLAYAHERHARTLQPQGERRTLFAPDLVGTSAEILDRLSEDRVLRETGELRLELPYNFTREDYEQILRDVALRVAPALGWVGPAGRDRDDRPPAAGQRRRVPA